MLRLFSERKDLVKTFEKKAEFEKVRKTNLFGKINVKFANLKQKIINDQIEETKNHRSEIKNFNRNFEIKKAKQI